MKPLANRLRPQGIDDLVGQDHLFQAPGGLLKGMLDKRHLVSMIFYGPPGSGKTSAAMAIANSLGWPYRLMNAVIHTKKDLDDLFVEAKMSDHLVLIMDEVHRLNKDKQDLLLPYVEDGTVTLIGATTANPFFSINQAIRSRVQLVEFKALTPSDIRLLLDRAIGHPQGLNGKVTADEACLDKISQLANGDVRYALNILEILALNSQDGHLTLDQLSLVANMDFYSDGDDFYDTLSGLQKSIRGSDVDASLYYLGKLIMAKDMASIERRLLVTAYEDIGLANMALVSRVLIAMESAKRVGFPEARIILSAMVIEMALSPKSKSAEKSIDKVLSSLNTKAYKTPDYLRLNPVKTENNQQYPYDQKALWPYIQYLPDELKDQHFYEPENLQSNEKIYQDNLDKLRAIKRTKDINGLLAKINKNK